MKLTTAKLSGIALAALLMTSADARADLIHWSYSWSNTPSSVVSGSSSITLSNESLTQVVGNSNIVSTNLQTTSTAPDDKPDTFKNKAYVLSLTIFDNASGQSATIPFSGVFNGTVSADSAVITTTFDPPTTQYVILGKKIYTVSLLYFTPPSPPSATSTDSKCADYTCTAGSIGATVTVEMPEPRSLFLAGLGAMLIGFVYTRNRWNRFPLLPA